MAPILKWAASASINVMRPLRAEKKASPYTVRNYGTDLMDFARFLVDAAMARESPLDVLLGLMGLLADRLICLDQGPS